MKKIPTLFNRNWEGDHKVMPTVYPGCEWVLAGEGVATRKLDGTCCIIRDGKLYKRQECREGAPLPNGFEEVDLYKETGKLVGWCPVGDGKEDKWYREGFANLDNKLNGTYELVGPKVQGNPELYVVHTLVPHTVECLCLTDDVPRDFEGLKIYLDHEDLEGIVFHHPDGRRAKIKKRDFGLRRRLLR